MTGPTEFLYVYRLDVRRHHWVLMTSSGFLLELDGRPVVLPGAGQATEMPDMRERVLAIPDAWDADTIRVAISEIESFLDYEEQSGRLDDRTREGLVVALEVLNRVARAYAGRPG